MLEARQRFTDIMQGLQRDNAALKERAKELDAVVEQLHAAQAEQARLTRELDAAVREAARLRDQLTGTEVRTRTLDALALDAGSDRAVLQTRLERVERELQATSLQRDLLLTELAWQRQAGRGPKPAVSEG